MHLQQYSSKPIVRTCMPPPFNVEHFKNQLNTAWLGSEFLHLEKVDSTSSYLKKISSSELSHGMVVIADHQTKGRGQYERQWKAEPGKDLTFTMAFRPSSAERLTLLTLSCANAVAVVLEDILKTSVQIKWPNDLYVGEKKIAGVLTECCFNGKQLERVLIGIGLNMGRTNFNEDLLKSATSVSAIIKEGYPRERMLCQVLSAIENGYMRWHKLDRTLEKEINQKMIGYGQWVSLQINKKIQPQKYKFLGVNQKGELVALDEQLEVNTFSYEQIRIIPDRKGISKTEK